MNQGCTVKRNIELCALEFTGRNKRDGECDVADSFVEARGRQESDIGQTGQAGDLTADCRHGNDQQQQR